MPDSIYKREINGEDGTVLQVRVPHHGDGKIRVITDPYTGKPAWLTLEQAREAHEALAEAIFAAEQASLPWQPIETLMTAKGEELL